MLSDDQIARYRSEGFLILRQVIEPGLMASLIEAADTMAIDALELGLDGSDVIEVDDVASRAAGATLIRRIKSPHRHHRAFARSQIEPALLDLVEALIGPDIRWHHTKLNAKQPAGSGHVEWHTDWGYYPHTNCDLLELSIPIDPSTESNGCLWVVPGSHQGPALDHTEAGQFVGAVAPGTVDLDTAVPIELEPGDLSIHHVRLLHGSGPNRTDSQRRLLLQGYAAADAWPLMAHHQPSDWSDWDDRIVRGHPTAEARLDGSPVRIPLPVATALGLFETQRKLSVSHFVDANRLGAE